MTIDAFKLIDDNPDASIVVRYAQFRALAWEQAQRQSEDLRRQQHDARIERKMIERCIHACLHILSPNDACTKDFIDGIGICIETIRALAPTESAAMQEDIAVAKDALQSDEPMLARTAESDEAMRLEGFNAAAEFLLDNNWIEPVNELRAEIERRKHGS